MNKRVKILGQRICGVAVVSGIVSATGNVQAAEDSGRNALGFEGLEEIVVTAQKRQQRLQDVPMSITAIGASEIDRRGLVHAEDYLRGMPGVNQTSQTPGGQAIVIRGLADGLANQNSVAGPTTATYFGETPTSTAAGLGAGASIDIKLVDIERVEVLRGPQGTAFGNSSLGGVVRVIPAAPKLDIWESRVSAGYSATSGTGGDNYNFQAMGNVPLIGDKLAIRATAYKFSDSGYYRNRAGSDPAMQAAAERYGAQAFAIDEEEVGAYSSTGARISALFQPSDDLRFTLSYLTQDNETDGFALGRRGTYEQTILRIAPEHVHRGQNGGSYDFNIDIANALMEYDFGWADLLATYSHTKSGSTQGRSQTDFGPVLAFLGGDQPRSTSSVYTHRGNASEIRIVSKFEGTWNFLAGLYAEKLDDEGATNHVWHGAPEANPLVPGARLLRDSLERRELTQKAVFGEVSWEFLPGVTLTGGVRGYDYERTGRLDESGPLVGGIVPTRRGDTQESGVNFRGNLSYKPNDDSLLYASWAQGFRIGRSQPGAPIATCDRDNNGLVDGTGITIESTRTVDSDTLDNYELGAKFALFDRNLTIDTSVFRMDWTDVPVFFFLTTCQPVSSYVANAGLARSEGVELEVNYRVTDAFGINFGGSWIDARLTKDVPAQNWHAGDQLPGAPQGIAHLGVEYAFDIAGHAASVRVDSIYVDSFIGDLNAPKIPEYLAGDYVKLDTSFRVTIRDVDIDLFVRNLANEDAYTFNRGVALNGTLLQPRTIGLQLGYTF